jgi:hypothetical protein
MNITLNWTVITTLNNSNWIFFIVHKSAKQKRPADVVLLVDATGSMLSWFSERMNRVQNITRSLALQFLESNHHNRIAIAQFDYYQGKILLELEKWQAPTVSSQSFFYFEFQNLLQF